MPEWMVVSSQLSDVGQKRKHNEDYVGYYEPGHITDLKAHGRLYVLADGVGGAAAGDIASRYAVIKIISEYYRQDIGDDPGTRLRRAIEEANANIAGQNRDRSDHRQMATTVVAAVIRGDDLTVANVGDSRAYLIRGYSFDQVTEDHSLMAEMINDGVITPDQAANHPYRNVILRSVGAYETVQVDLFTRHVVPDDILILCSDGLTQLVSNQELAEITRAHPPAESARQLVGLANERGGDDNISVSITLISHDQVEGDITDAGELPEVPRLEDLQYP